MELGRLQCFVDTYLEAITVLGLEYVLEMQTGPFYHYKCTLCNKKLDWQHMVSHITQLSHMFAYVIRHHGDLTSVHFKNLNKVEQMRELNILAETIQTKYGRKQVCVKEPDVDAPEPPAEADPAHEEHSKRDGNYSGAPQGCAKESALQEGSKGSGASRDFIHYCWLCFACSPSFPALSKHVMSAQHRRHVQEIRQEHKRQAQYRCLLCKVSCLSFMTLSDHVMGSKHRLNLKSSSTRTEVSEVGRLGHFMGTYMQQESILGLEYIVETKMGDVYKYTCTLCKMNGMLRQIVAHLLVRGHLYLYIKNHHDSMLLSIPRGSNRGLFDSFLRDLAEKILDREWYKENGESVAGGSKSREDSVGEKGDASPSGGDGGSSFHSKRTPLPYPEEGCDKTTPVIDDPPLTKRGRLEALSSTTHSSTDPHYDERHAMEQVPSAIQEFQFHNNHQFFEYLSNFKIKDSHDIILIQKIIPNCIRALKRFQEEDAQMQIPALEPEAPLTATSRIDQEILVVSVKSESPPLAPETVLPKQTSNPPSEIIPKNKLTDFFFSSIKNMHESEVVGIFQKVATANPAFQEMNIPAVIRYLKDSGRLNTT